MARKVITQKARVGGLEAPRNSLELPVETSQCYYAAGDNFPYTYGGMNDWSENYYPAEAPIKKLINEEISKRPNTRHNVPSVVARLMGVDMLPLDTKLVGKQIEKKKNPWTNLKNEEHAKKSSLGIFHHNEDRDPDRNFKPKPREHPQEEELQKFKKEFEAWQKAKIKQVSEENHGINNCEKLAQESLNKEKMALYGPSSVDPKEPFSRSKKQCKDLEQFSAPTKIVILRPGPDRIGYLEDSLASSSGTSEERGSIEDFLEEVKERLKSELQGKSHKKGSMVRGGGIETPYSEKPSDPKQIAQRIAKHVRDSVKSDLGIGTNLLRSESTRSYKSEIQQNGAGSPEFISKDTRRFLSERLRNVLNIEANLDIPGSSIRGTPELRNMKDEQDIKSRSFRRGSDDAIVHHEDLSPRNLIRSMSAPVSGTSFGKLLLEDRHVLTGVHIRRKHEAPEKRVAVNLRKRKKDKVSFREKVSSFKYGFVLRGRLFGRKSQSSEDLHYNRRDFVNDIMSGPTVVMNFNDSHENSTEVPPSPASVCSSAQEELWRLAENCSSTSVSEMPPLDDNAMPMVFRDISSNLNELRRQLNKLGTDNFEETMSEDHHPLESEMVEEIEDQAEAYVRDLLIASGLYDGSIDKSLSRWDPLAKPITNQVFEQVKESFLEREKDRTEKKMDHKLLLDLLNEALSTVLGPPMTMSRFMKKAIGTTPPCPPRGRMLLDHVWGIIRVYVYPPPEISVYSLESMVARDLKWAPWSRLIDDDVNAVAKEMESHIFGDLIEEVIKDIRAY